MTINVTPDPTFSPPRNKIDLAATVGSLYQALSLYRVQSGQQTLLRTQPSVGGTVATVYDYECPYNTPVTYRAVGGEISSIPVTEWSESWANTSAWTITGGSASVASGILTITGSNTFVYRRVAGGANYRVTANALRVNAILTLGCDDDSIFITVTGSGVTVIVGGIGHTVAATVGSGLDIQADITGSQFTLTLNGVSTMYGWNGGNLGIIQASASTLTSAVWGGSVVAQAYPTMETPVDETSPVETLTATSGWLVHPFTPSLSMPVSTTDRTMVGISNLGPVTSSATSTVHQILGQATPIISTTGPRLSDALTVIFAARSVAQEGQLVALFRDQTPILIRMVDLDLGWVDGFYSVGDVSRARFAQRAGEQRRDFTLPLQMVQPPVGSVANPGWSWAALAATFSSWDEVRNAYSTWANLAANVGN